MTLMMTPNFLITVRQNTERGRNWVKTSVLAWRPPNPQEVAPMTRGKGVAEASLMAADNSHQKAAGERQVEAKPEDRYSGDQGSQDYWTRGRV